MRCSGLLPGLVLLAVVPAYAQVLPDSIQACRAETDSRLRLECFDREVAKYPLTAAQGFGLNARELREAQQRLVAGAPAGAPPGAARAPVNAAGAAGAPARARAGSESSTRVLTAKVRAVSIRQGGVYTLLLDNDQTWAETDRDGAERVAAGDTVRIDPGLFGSYFLVDQDSHWAAKVRRLQ